MEYEQITKELERVIEQEKGKTYLTFETRVIDMAEDCLRFIKENNPKKSPIKRRLVREVAGSPYWDYCCSLCNSDIDGAPNYCGHCGAELDWSTSSAK